jgi:hypothetical protein
MLNAETDTPKRDNSQGPQPSASRGYLGDDPLPAHDKDMRATVAALVERKFGPGGPFNPKTLGPWKNTLKIHAAAKDYNKKFEDCVATMAQYMCEQFGKFPGTVPTMYILTYLQTHRLDLELYDRLKS